MRPVKSASRAEGGGTRCLGKRTFAGILKRSADRRPDRGRGVLFTRRENLWRGYWMPLPQNEPLRLIKGYYVKVGHSSERSPHE